MRPHDLEFRSRAVSAWACVSEAWQLIRDEYWFFLGLTFVGVLISSFAQLILIGPVMCGIHLCFLPANADCRFASRCCSTASTVAQSLIATLIMLVPEAIVFIVGYTLFYVILFGGVFVAVGINPPPQNPGVQQLPDPLVGVAMLTGGSLGLFVTFVLAVLLQSLFFVRISADRGQGAIGVGSDQAELPGRPGESWRHRSFGAFAAAV